MEQWTINILLGQPELRVSHQEFSNLRERCIIDLEIV